MTATLAAGFRNGNGRKVKWQGKTVRSVVELSAKDGDIIEVTRLSASTVRAQALKVAIDRGNLRANGIVIPTVAIWTHTAPERVTLEVTGRRSRSIDVWNSWSLDGVDSAWLGNAGMVVEADGNGHILRCSDGVGNPTFDDLIVRVEIHNG